jgi:hypothetical protein
MYNIIPSVHQAPNSCLSTTIGTKVNNNSAFDIDKPIYTYVDRDYFVCKDESSVCRYTSSRDSRATNLTNAINGLPVHNLHSKATLEPSAAVLHDRISRDCTFKMMYIMASVDCDVEQ